MNILKINHTAFCKQRREHNETMILKMPTIGYKLPMHRVVLHMVCAHTIRCYDCYLSDEWYQSCTPELEKDSVRSDPWSLFRPWLTGVTDRTWYGPTHLLILSSDPCSVLCWSSQVEPMHSISGREGICIHCWMQDTRTTLPYACYNWLLPGDSRIRARGRENTSGGGEARFRLYLRLWSDYFSPVPSPADRSLPGRGPVERFSPQIFGNKVRYNDCARSSSPWGNWDSITIYLGIYRPFCSRVPG